MPTRRTGTLLAYGSISQSSWLADSSRDIDAIEELDESTLREEKRIRQYRVEERRQENQHLEQRYRHFRRNQLVHDLCLRLNFHISLGSSRHADINYEEALKAVKSFEVQKGKERKVEQQRQRRREAALLLAVAKRNKAQDQLSRAQRKDKRSKLSRTVAAADRKIASIRQALDKDLSHRADIFLSDYTATHLPLSTLSTKTTMPLPSQESFATAIVDSANASTPKSPSKPSGLEGTGSVISNQQVAPSSNRNGTRFKQTTLPPSFATGSLSNKACGPLPEWAYFYEPPLSLPQVEFVQARMKSTEEYKKMRPGPRIHAEIRDLSNAIHAMREAFGRTDLIVRSASGTPPNATPSSTDRPSSLKKSSTHGATAETAIDLDGSEDDETLDASRSSSTSKRSTTGDCAEPKRQKVSSGRANGIFSSDITAKPLESHANLFPSTPAEAAQYIENGQRRVLRLAEMPEDLEHFEVTRGHGGNRKIQTKRKGTVRWYDEEIRILVRWRDAGRSWEDICKVRVHYQKHRQEHSSSTPFRTHWANIDLCGQGRSETHTYGHPEKIWGSTRRPAAEDTRG